MREQPNPAANMIALDRSLRDWFAGQALAGILASYAGAPTLPPGPLTAERAYLMADAMLAERAKPAGEPAP